MGLNSASTGTSTIMKISMFQIMEEVQGIIGLVDTTRYPPPNCQASYNLPSVMYIYACVILFL